MSIFLAPSSGGAPGGSSTQVQFNSAGSFGGISTLTYDGSILTTSGRFTNSYNATASAPAQGFTGTWFTGGTATTTKPQVLIEPTGTTSTAWSTSGTGLGVNAPSGFAGRVFDFQLNGTSKFYLDDAGGSTHVALTGAAIVRVQASGTPFVGTISNHRFGVMANGAERIVVSTAGLVAYGNGLTSSIPALKPSGTALQVRLADDSGYTTIDGQLRAQGSAPASASAAGTAGDIRYDADYVYICTASNTWKRAAISTW